MSTFQWNDELVKEYLATRLGDTIQDMEHFKKSKEKQPERIRVEIDGGGMKGVSARIIPRNFEDVISREKFPLFKEAIEAILSDDDSVIKVRKEYWKELHKKMDEQDGIIEQKKKRQGGFMYDQKEVDKIRKDTWEAARGLSIDGMFNVPMYNNFEAYIHSLPENKLLNQAVFPIPKYTDFFNEEEWAKIRDKGETFVNERFEFTIKPYTEQPKSDWEILHFASVTNPENPYNHWYLLPNGKYNCGVKHSNEFTLHKMLHEENCVDNGKIAIQSVRLSNGEIFTVGDVIEINIGTIKKAPIERFEVSYFDNTHISAYHSYAGRGHKAWKKVSPALFTTNDGVEIRNSEDYWWVGEDYRLWKDKAYPTTVITKHQKTFSRESSASAYIVDNQPCLSRREMMDMVNMIADATSGHDNKSYLSNLSYVKVKEKLHL